jgi:hypothetical protein
MSGQLAVTLHAVEEPPHLEGDRIGDLLVTADEAAVRPPPDEAEDGMAHRLALALVAEDAICVTLHLRRAVLRRQRQLRQAPQGGGIDPRGAPPTRDVVPSAVRLSFGAVAAAPAAGAVVEVEVVTEVDLTPEKVGPAIIAGVAGAVEDRFRVRVGMYFLG